MKSLRSVFLITSVSFRAAPGLSALSLVFVPLARGSMVLTGVLLKELADAVIAGDDGRIILFAFVLGAFAGIRWLLFSIETKVKMSLNERVGHALQSRVTEVTAKVPDIEHFDRSEFLDQLLMLQTAQWQIAGVTETLLSTAATAAVLLGAIFLLANVDLALALLPLASVPAIVVTVLQSRRARSVEEATASNWRQAEQLFRSTLTPAAAKEIRVFGLRDGLIRRQADARRIRTDAIERVESVYAVGHALAWTVQGAAFLVAAIYVFDRARDGSVSLGDFALVVVLGQQIADQTAAIVGRFAELAMMLRTTSRLGWILDYGRARSRRSGSGPAPATIRQGIDLDGVAFRYPGSDVDVLREVDLHLPAGSVVAIVGENGAGKTTLVKLLCRMYEPTAGTIRVDGTDLSSIDPEAWCSRTTAAFQDHAMFELRLREAIGIGDLAHVGDEGHVHAALQRADADDLPHEVHDGLDAQLGSRWDSGVDLSGGQWQKVALARAFMRDDPLLVVLDEPTAALDAHTEHRLFERYAAVRRDGAVTVLVSHRFSTVRMADHIVVIADGRIVEQGDHRSLLASGGRYAELYGIQAAAYR